MHRYLRYGRTAWTLSNGSDGAVLLACVLLAACGAAACSAESSGLAGVRDIAAATAGLGGASGGGLGGASGGGLGGASGDASESRGGAPSTRANAGGSSAGGKSGAPGTTVPRGGGSGSAGAVAATGGSAAMPAGSGAVDDVPAGTLCARLSALQCEAEAACCDAPGRTSDECKTAMAAECAKVYLDAVSASDLSGYSAHTAGLALADFERRASTCDSSVVSWGASGSGLRAIFPGTRSAGADCTPANVLDAAEAASNLMSCKNPADTACLPSLTTWKCSARASVGGRCFTDTNCQDESYCDNPQSLPVGATCKARKAAGTSCTGSGQCASLVCRGGLCVAAQVQSVYCLRDG